MVPGMRVLRIPTIGPTSVLLGLLSVAQSGISLALQTLSLMKTEVEEHSVLVRNYCGQRFLLLCLS